MDLPSDQSGEVVAARPSRAVFLSYASEDAAAADRIREALKAHGIEVWLDKSELRGGDAWDASIRQQIKACVLFLPLISAHSRARGEGYFRLEWKLAIDRSHLMAGDQPFLCPVALDATRESDARVPDRFLDYQWIRVASEAGLDDLVRRVRELLARINVGAGSGNDERSVVPVPTRPTGADAHLLTANGGRRRWIWVAAAVVLMAIAILMAFSPRHSETVADVQPYSREDRRMSFALLPLTAPTADSRAIEIAQGASNVIQSDLESNKYWVQAVTRPQVDVAMTRDSSPRALAHDLNVHFLVRGAIARTGPDYQIKLYVVDGDTERTLGDETLAAPADLQSPQFAEDVGSAMGLLVFHALEQEVRNAAHKDFERLDVRDLTFRAYVQWGTHAQSDGRKGYMEASALLKRALTLAPDDPLALKVTAEVNLCDCVGAWSKHPEEQRAIGAAALDRFLALDPAATGMRLRKATVLQLYGRWEEALDIADDILQLKPVDVEARTVKVESLLKLGRAREALPIADELMASQQQHFPEYIAGDADVHFALGDYETAARLARLAVSRFTEDQLRNREAGSIRLTLAAAEAELGHKDRAAQVLADFRQSVPDAASIGGVRKWISPNADLSDFEPLFVGLRLAGMKD